MSDHFKKCPKCGRFIKRRRRGKCAHCHWREPRGIEPPSPQRRKKK